MRRHYFGFDTWRLTNSSVDRLIKFPGLHTVVFKGPNVCARTKQCTVCFAEEEFQKRFGTVDENKSDSE